MLESPSLALIMRKCWNWQTSKTKDLVVGTPCGFKSHLPHFANDADMAELAYAHDSGSCPCTWVWVQVPLSARILPVGDSSPAVFLFIPKWNRPADRLKRSGFKQREGRSRTKGFMSGVTE